MSTDNCNNKLPCGCTDHSLGTPPPCETGTTACPNPDPCPETFSAGCTVWTGQDIICNSTVIASEGMRMDQIIETMVALFCGPQTPPQSGITLNSPDPDGFIASPDDVYICIDRNNCFEDLVVSLGPTAPEAILFTWIDIDGNPHTNEPTMLIENGRSCLLFSWDYGVLPPGQYSFDFIVTGCGTTVNVPVFITVS